MNNKNTNNQGSSDNRDSNSNNSNNNNNNNSGWNPGWGNFDDIMRQFQQGGMGLTRPLPTIILLIPAAAIPEAPAGAAKGTLFFSNLASI